MENFKFLEEYSRLNQAMYDGQPNSKKHKKYDKAISKNIIQTTYDSWIRESFFTDPWEKFH